MCDGLKEAAPEVERRRFSQAPADTLAKDRVGTGQIGYRSIDEILADLFSYHDDPRKVPNYVAIRTAAKNLVTVILQNAPDSADRTYAIRCVREAVLWANAAVALDGRNL